jgi:pimeloyl-ACP methyl ester carboxylesterase
MAGGLPDAELIVVPGAGHLAMMERPDQVNTALRALISLAARPGIDGA